MSWVLPRPMRPSTPQAGRSKVENRTNKQRPPSSSSSGNEGSSQREEQFQSTTSTNTASSSVDTWETVSFEGAIDIRKTSACERACRNCGANTPLVYDGVEHHVSELAPEEERLGEQTETKDLSLPSGWGSDEPLEQVKNGTLGQQRDVGIIVYNICACGESGCKSRCGEGPQPHQLRFNPRPVIEYLTIMPFVTGGIRGPEI